MSEKEMRDESACEDSTLALGRLAEEPCLTDPAAFGQRSSSSIPVEKSRDMDLTC